jgi:hypothetical protein
MHKPIKVRFLGEKATALLRKAAPAMKVALALLKIGVLAAKVVGIGVPCPDKFDLADKIGELADVFESMAETGANVITFTEVAIEENELEAEVSYTCVIMLH